MITLTHFHFSNIIYRQLLKNTGIRLNWRAFAYGNIKPDFKNEDIKCEHYLDESIDEISRYSQNLIGESMNIKQFSVRLGVISHFLCDYFCLYHQDGYKQRGNIVHTLYEIILHFRFLLLLMSGRLVKKPSGAHRSDLKTALMQAGSDYNLAKKNMSRDIIYSVSFTAQICEMIILSCSSISIQDTIDIRKELGLGQVN